MFGKRKRWGALSPEERMAAADGFLVHLVNVATGGHLADDEAGADEAAAHINADVKGAPYGLLVLALARAVTFEGHAQAQHVRGATDALLGDLVESILKEEGPAPTDLLPDDEPAPTDTYGDPEGRSWPEDRR